MRERILAYVLKYAPTVGYPLFYVFCLAVFLPLTFPYDRLKERIVSSMSLTSAASSRSKRSTGAATCRSTGCPIFKTVLTAMGALSQNVTGRARNSSVPISISKPIPTPNEAERC